MSGQQELEIEIDPQGRVQVHVKGMPGKRCLEFVKVFQELLGPVTEQRPTPEIYEAEVQTQVTQRQRW